jgi:hypothetical protein
MIARTSSMWVDIDYRFKRDPRPRIQATIAAAEHALKRNPDAAAAYNFIGNAWGAQVDRWEEPHGLDPRASLQKSIDAYDACNRIRPTPDCYANAGVSRAALARWQMAHGLDAAATIEATVRNYEDAARFPDMTQPHYNICSTLASYARDRIENGVDPTPLFARARPHCEQAKKEDAGMVDARHTFGAMELALGLDAARGGRDPLRDWREGEDDLQAALRLEEKRDDVRADLAELLGARAQYLAAHQQPFADDLGRALDEARHAARNSPDDAEAQRALARAALMAARLHDRRALAEGLAAGRRAFDLKHDDVAAMLLVLELEWLDHRRDPDLLARAQSVNPHHPRLAQLAAAY